VAVHLRICDEGPGRWGGRGSVAVHLRMCDEGPGKGGGGGGPRLSTEGYAMKDPGGGGGGRSWGGYRDIDE
jgi:hypothetical protein